MLFNMENKIIYQVLFVYRIYEGTVLCRRLRDAGKRSDKWNFSLRIKHKGNKHQSNQVWGIW